MNAYRLALQQFLLDHGLNHEPRATNHESRVYDRLEAFTFAVFGAGWLIAIVTHL